MIVFWSGIAFMILFGVILYIRRDEVAQGMAMFSGASTPPGCAVAISVSLFILAAVGVVLYQMGLFGKL